MVISNIIGGLGNQLFQYAAGKSLATHHNTRLKLDLSAFDSYTLRNFILNIFELNYETAETDEIKSFTQRNIFDRIKDNIPLLSDGRYFRERFFHFDDSFFKRPADVYLKGYWQSEKYFSSIADIIHKEFRVKKEHIANITETARQINDQPSASVHIRRGDYTNPEILRVHGVLDETYYQKAIDQLLTIQPETIFYIFSDDINWVKENLRIENKKIVSGNLSKTAIEDFYLMSQCRHNIIANSSFSWWAAWLNENKNKTVIAPANWFNEGPKDTYDIYPDGWIQL